MKSVALELGQYGVTVMPAIPGMTDTPLIRHRKYYAQPIDNLNNIGRLDKLETETKQKLTTKSQGGDSANNNA